MRKFNSKAKKKARKPLHSRTRLGHPQPNDESNMTIPESSVRNARIRSAIANGFRLSLPSDTQGLNLSKFEHVGKGGPLVVYAEDKKMFNEFGHFTVITSFRPSDSLRNQLFFASRKDSSPFNQKQLTERDVQTKNDVIQDGKTSLPNTTLSNPKNNSAKAKQTLRQPNSFEELVKRYKDRQEKYFHLLGDESLYLFQKIDRMCTAGKREVDINFPTQDDPKKKIIETKNGTEDTKFLPKITVQKPGVKKVHIELPPQSRQAVFKDKTENILPSI